MKKQLRRFAGPALLGIALIIAFSSPAWARIGDGGLSDGAVHLRLNHGATEGGRLNVNGAMPGDSGSHAYPVENVGKLPGNLSISIPAVINTAATSGPQIDGRGDLGAETEVALFFDMDGDAAWSVGDVGLACDGSKYAAGPLTYAPLDSYGAANWQDVVEVGGGQQCTLMLLWRIPATAGNEIQGDSVSFDIRFSLVQSLH